MGKTISIVLALSDKQMYCTSRRSLHFHYFPRRWKQFYILEINVRGRPKRRLITWLLFSRSSISSLLPEEKKRRGKKTRKIAINWFSFLIMWVYHLRFYIPSWEIYKNYSRENWIVFRLRFSDFLLCMSFILHVFFLLSLSFHIF